MPSSTDPSARGCTPSWPTREQLKKAGMQVTELSADEQAKMREKMKPVIDKHAASVGEGTVKDLMAELARLRK